MSDMREVELPAALCDQAEKKFSGRFANLQELLTFAMQELVREDSSQADEAEQKIVEERLRDLGYI
jgi:hypothetical protein